MLRQISTTSFPGSFLLILRSLEQAEFPLLFLVFANFPLVIKGHYEANQRFSFQNNLYFRLDSNTLKMLNGHILLRLQDLRREVGVVCSWARRRLHIFNKGASASHCKITTLLFSPVTFTYIRWSKIPWSKIVSLFCKAWARLKRFGFNLKYLVPSSLLYH